MLGTGLQSIITGLQIMLSTCNPEVALFGYLGVVAGISTMAFGTAEIQESLGYGNWIKDSGLKGEEYDMLMGISYGISTFVNIVGPIANKYGPKCFKAGTLVMTATGYKAIEEIAVGDKVLAYNEETGERDYKEVLQLFRNDSCDWTGITVNGTEIVSTPGHKYYIPESKEWVPAEELKEGNKVLLFDGNYGIIEKVRDIHYTEPQVTYNFEVEGYHTYYVGVGVCVHNRGGCTPKDPQLPDDGVANSTALRRDAKGRLYDAKTYGLDGRVVARIDFQGTAHKIDGVKTIPHVHLFDYSNGYKNKIEPISLKTYVGGL